MGPYGYKSGIYWYNKCTFYNLDRHNLFTGKKRQVIKLCSDLNTSIANYLYRMTNLCKTFTTVH